MVCLIVELMQNRNLAKEIFTRKHDIASSITRCKQLPVVASSSSIVENIFKVFSSFSTGKEVSIMSATFSLDIALIQVMMKKVALMFDSSIKAIFLTQTI